VRWSRVVLDEAHLISNRNSLQSKAVVALSSVARWTVTGLSVSLARARSLSLCFSLHFSLFHARSLMRCLRFPLDM